MRRPHAARSIGISEQTHYRWRAYYGSMKMDQVKQLKELDTENAGFGGRHGPDFRQYPARPPHVPLSRARLDDLRLSNGIGCAEEMFGGGGGEDGEGREPQQIHVEVRSGRRVEVISGAERRRRWAREKAQITAESFAPGANVSEVARRHGMSLGLLHHWRRLARERAESAAPSFVPVLPAEEPAPPRRPSATSLIEIDLWNVCVRVRGLVDAENLRAVIVAVREA